MKVRDLNDHETSDLWEIYWGTVHKVNIRDYTAKQVEAWAPTDFDREWWRNRILGLRPFVVEADGQIIGYSDLQPRGLIDHLFVHHRWQRQGVGRLLMQEIESRARRARLTELESHVSITARPFFERFDFHVVTEQDNEVRGVTIKNYIMRRRL